MQISGTLLVISDILRAQAKEPNSRRKGSRSSRQEGTEKSQRGQALAQHLPTALRANPMPNKSGPAPKAETDQKTPIIGANGCFPAITPRLASGWQGSGVGRIDFNFISTRSVGLSLSQ